MLPAADLVSIQQEALTEQDGRTAGPRRPGRPPVHRGDRDRTWLTDITEHPTAEGKLYLCAFKDVYSGRIVSYSMSSRVTAGLAVSALRNAIAPREPAGTLIVHSDRGSSGPQRSSGH
jgi:transposase InsO family protein